MLSSIFNFINMILGFFKNISQGKQPTDKQVEDSLHSLKQEADSEQVSLDEAIKENEQTKSTTTQTK